MAMVKKEAFMQIYLKPEMNINHALLIDVTKYFELFGRNGMALKEVTEKRAQFQMKFIKEISKAYLTST